MSVRAMTIFLAIVLAVLILFENRTGSNTGFFPYIILLLVTPLFIYDIWRRRKTGRPS
ncbi:hypothetical protein [Natribacillus halophilus]|uniref:hypothetical protein n=1 Tax=Natribacillus halophilus TaxID=549003 RepID=UPI0015A22265|nr:hypothetical protein [Natribacillus halophilus]